MYSKIIRSLIFIMVIALAVTVYSPVSQAVIQQSALDVLDLDLSGLDSITFTAAHPSPPDPHLQDHASMVAFKEYVEKVSDGKITVNLSPGGELGDLGELQELAMDGIVEVILTSDGAISTIYPNIQVVSLPYLFRDVDHALHVFDGELGQTLFEDMRLDTGLKTIAWFDNGGFRSFTNNVREIRTPEDMEGLTIRVMEIPSHIELVERLGAKAVTIPWTELYTGLATGVADGQENAIPTLMMAKVYEVQDYLTLDRHFFSMTQILANDDWFQALPVEYQAIILEGGRRMSEVARRQTRIMRVAGEEYLRGQGVQIYNPTEDEMQLFREATQEPVTEFVRNAVADETWVDDIIAEAEKALGELGYDEVGAN